MDDSTTSLTSRLTDLSRNLWWTWHPEVVAIFRDVEPALWREVNHNPIAFVKRLTPEQWSRHAEETVIEIRVNRAFRRLEEYLRESGTWASRFCNVLKAQPVVYFSAEFALHESLPTYSGGLGVLAGDHLKSCSDLGVPFVGVGIFYGQGYFRQGFDINGWQQESYGHIDVEQLPLSRVTAADGRPVVIEIPLDGGSLRIGAWRADVGRSTLLLLDSDVEGNPRDSRELTAQLYGGDQRVRIRQELLLGVGGVRMLNALGIRPGVLHLNEGYSAFAPLEVARQRAIAEGVSLLAALREVALQTVFTTHTPVAAGHDRFPPGLVLGHLDWLLRETGLSADELLGLGRVNPGDPQETFCMTVLALRSSRHANGVSAIHGHVSRQMWQNLWPGRPEAEVPIGHITNGAHSPSWLAPEMFELFERHLGSDWRERMCCADVWQGIATLDDAALWEMHQVLKRRLLRYVARRVAERREAPAPALRPDVLTLTFARRFTEYKRPAMLLADLDRLARLVNDPNRGLQIIFAGKAHPRDDDGKRLLQGVFALTRDPRFRSAVAFVADYDFGVARHFLQGSDLWLNTPRRPLEACGTSGQKAVLNGVLHLSVLDGWWAGAHDGENGFAIGDRLTHANSALQDARDTESLYRVLEEEVVPMYYERDAANVPCRWVGRMKRAITTLASHFNADRMVRDYVRHCYLPAAGGLTSGMPGTSRPAIVMGDLTG